MPVISVIVPVYNAEKFLAECIESILTQSYRDFELVLVDDGSTDRSSQICDEYSRKDDRIKVIHQPNGGVTSARKTGWQQSKGEWIVFSDADDTVPVDCLEIMLTPALNNGCDIVNARYQAFPSNNIGGHKTFGELTRKEYLESFIYTPCYGVVFASIYKKSLFQDSTFAFDSSLKIGEDALTCIELGLRASKVLNIKNIVYHYRVNNIDSVMNQKVRHPSYLGRFYDVMEELLRHEEDIDESCFELLQKTKFNHQLKAFFSPFLSFDENYYLILKEKLKERLNNTTIPEIITGRNKIYRLALKNILIAKLVKIFYLLGSITKRVLKRKSIVKKEVLY